VKKEDGAEPRVLPLLGFKPLIGVVHLPPLHRPGRPGTDIEDLIDYAVNEALKLERASFDAVIVENYGDKPFHMTYTGDHTVASLMTAIVREVSRNTSLIVGVNILRNDGVAALSSAFAGGARFIRVNSYCETRLTPEGIMKPIGAYVEDIRLSIPRYIAVFADVDVKHSYGLTPVEHAVRECIERGFMDAVVVSGSRTGAAPDPGYVASIRALASGKPVILGSGLTLDNIGLYWNIVDGFIVGTSIKIDGTDSPIALEKAVALARRVRELRANSVYNVPLGGRYSARNPA